MREEYDVIVIGTGISGLTSAIYLKEAGLNVLVITKTDEISKSNTHYAQGGIIAYKKGDSSEKLAEDIYNAGCRYNNVDAVKTLTEQGPELVFDFLIDRLKISFSKDSLGNVDYTGEAAHSERRIIHDYDHTGSTIEKGLIEYAEQIGVKVFNEHTAIDLITNNHHSTDCQELYKEREVFGAYILDNKNNEVKTVFASRIILATGGVGNLYLYTTNPELSTGDGISMAYRAGADIINGEFVQFHPTSLFHKDIKRFLISESLRGEGARLLNHKGEFFMSKYSPYEEMAPRDVVARAIYEEMSNEGSEYMLLDIANHYKGDLSLDKRFSQIYKTCLRGGIDITKEAIPIVPAAHYFCGGIKVDVNGMSSVKNLYAIGEVSCTGLHGANRLASTSLLEGLVWAKRASESIISSFKNISKDRFDAIPEWQTPKYTEEFDPLLLKQDMQAIRMTMWNYAGIVRTKKGLDRARSDLNYYSHRILKFYHTAMLKRDIIELRNSIVTAQIIVNSAIHNTKSLGCHYIKF